MGYLKNEFGITLVDDMPEGKCRECATDHAPEMPHNRQSLTYQYKFYDKHGHWPTWADAMAHCSEEMKALWSAALTNRGIEINENR